MKSRYHVIAVMLLVAAMGFAAQAEAAARPSLTGISRSAITSDAADIPGRVAYVTLLSTGFEPGQGFVVNPLEPQQGWTASGVNLPFVSVSNAFAHSGTQHERIVHDNTQGVGVNRVVLSPLDAGILPGSPSTTTQWINISNDLGADYDVFGQSPSEAFITWRVKFHYSDGTGSGAPPGIIAILDDVGGGVLNFVNTGLPWNQNQYSELKVQFDPANSEIRYFYDGVLIYVGYTIYAGTKVEQVGSVNDNYQLDGAETADFDDITLIDTPTDPTAAAPTSWGRIKKAYR